MTGPHGRRAAGSVLAGWILLPGAMVRTIRLVEGDHDIDCRIEGIGAMSLKSAFVKKA